MLLVLCVTLVAARCRAFAMFCPVSTLGPVVQCVVSLTILLVVKILTVLVSTISNLQVFLLEKM